MTPRLRIAASVIPLVALALGLIACGNTPSKNPPFIFGLENHSKPMQVTVYGFNYSTSSRVTISFVGVPGTDGLQNVSKLETVPSTPPMTNGEGNFVYTFTPECLTHDSNYDNFTDLVLMLVVDDKTGYAAENNLHARDWYCPPPTPPPRPPNGGGGGCKKGEGGGCKD